TVYSGKLANRSCRKVHGFARRAGFTSFQLPRSRMPMNGSFAPLRGIARLAMAAFGLCLLALITPSASAQGGGTPAQPTQYTKVPVPKGEESTGAMRVLEAICWYIPNRIMDLTDIPRFHVAVGDGMGATVRITKWFFWASWFQSDTWNL